MADLLQQWIEQMCQDEAIRINVDQGGSRWVLVRATIA
jgi:hypothetical protein